MTARLPDLLPLLPLGGVVLLPQGTLPLNIFEERYLAMIEDALGRGRMIGLIQTAEDPLGGAPAPLYQIGCAGRITSFAETDDGRFLIQLTGVCRFRIGQEWPAERGYRRITPLWDDFMADLEPPPHPDYDRARLISALKTYFRLHGVKADWDVIQSTGSEKLISSLAMICPLPANEKQALLEAATPKARAELLTTLLEMASLHQTEESARH